MIAHRPDLAVLTEEDLIGASNKLTVKRARKDLDSDVSPVVETQDQTVELQWEDAHCTFPPGGLLASSCDCPARKLCKHRVRSVLWLQSQWSEGAAAVVGDESPADGSDETAPVTEWSPAEIELSVLEKGFGRATWRKACALLADGVEAVPESNSAATIPSLGVRVRFIPGDAKLDAALCSCGARKCVHRVMAALSFRPELPESVTAPDASWIPLSQRLLALVDELMRIGLDGIPVELGDALRGLSQASRAAGVYAAANDLDWLETQLDAYQARSARFSPTLWLRGITRLGARAQALPHRHTPRRRAVLKGRARRTYLDMGPQDLFGLGVETFVSDRGVFLRCWFQSLTTGEAVSASTGRPEISDVNQLWRAVTLLGESTAVDVVAKRVHLVGGRRAHDGAIAGVNASANVTAMRPSAFVEAAASFGASGLVVTDLPSLASRWSRLTPPVLRSSRDVSIPVLLKVAPGSIATPTFSEVTQSVSMPCLLEGGGVVDLVVPFGAGTKRQLEHLEQAGRWDGKLAYVFARVWPTRTGFTGRPIAVWLASEDADNSLTGPYPLALGTGPPTKAAEVPLDRRPQHPHPRLDNAAVVFRALLDELEGAAMAGFQRPSAARAERCARLAIRLRRLGLFVGADMVDAMRGDGMRVPQLVALVGWTLSMDERWGLRALGAESSSLDAAASAT